MKQLIAEKELEIRFSEVDSMSVVWHGSYPLYFEDARECFGKKFDLGYMKIFGNGYFAPLVEMTMKWHSPIRYEMKPLIRIIYVPTEAAKIVFRYEIINPENGVVLCTAETVQVFMDKNYELVWDNPEFYREWKERWAQI